MLGCIVNWPLLPKLLNPHIYLIIFLILKALLNHFPQQFRVAEASSNLHGGGIMHNSQDSTEPMDTCQVSALCVSCLVLNSCTHAHTHTHTHTQAQVVETRNNFGGAGVGSAMDTCPVSGLYTSCTSYYVWVFKSTCV